MSTNRGICFVIMPFSKTTDEHTKDYDYWTKRFERFLKPLIEENPKLEARRSETLRGDILGQIITDLVLSPVVVADLTDHTSNVYWELGVRQSFKHGTVTIAEAGTQLPFDVGGKGTLFYYPNDHLKMEDFRKRFKEAIQDCLENPDTPDSYVLESLSGRGTLFETFHRDEAIRRLEAVLSECNRNLDVLKKVAEQARINQKNPSKRKIPPISFRLAAVELLITNRYINEDDSLFKLAEEYGDAIARANYPLSNWISSPKATETWLLKEENSVAKLFNEFKAKVEAAYNKLSRQF